MCEANNMVLFFYPKKKSKKNGHNGSGGIDVDDDAIALQWCVYSGEFNFYATALILYIFMYFYVSYSLANFHVSR